MFGNKQLTNGLSFNRSNSQNSNLILKKVANFEQNFFCSANISTNLLISLCVNITQGTIQLPKMYKI